MRTAAAIALLLAACVPSEGPLMEPGQDCVRCHDGGEAQRWTVAGTFAPRGTEVTVTDAAGKSFTLRTNKVGNFYSAERLTFPLSVAVDGKSMSIPVTYGGCNLCHGSGAIETGEFMLPGQDCLQCHDGNVAKRWTVAGTWTPGATVTLAGNGQQVTLTANRVGNFFTDVPLLPLTTVRAGNETMSPPPDYGGCNRCHGHGGGGGGGDD